MSLSPYSVCRREGGGLVWRPSDHRGQVERSYKRAPAAGALHLLDLHRALRGGAGGGRPEGLRRRLRHRGGSQSRFESLFVSIAGYIERCPVDAGYRADVGAPGMMPFKKLSFGYLQLHTWIRLYGWTEQFCKMIRFHVFSFELTNNCLHVNNQLGTFWTVDIF